MPDGLAPRPAPASVAQHTDRAVLGRVAEHGVTLAVWRRPRDGAMEQLAGWLDALPPEHLPEGRFSGPVGDVSVRLALLCDLVELRDCRERALLIADIAALAGCFARLTGTDGIDLKLEAVDHDSCWRFHRDHVGLRLNATYRGAGTQWVPTDQARRALRGQRAYRGPLCELPRFGAGLFKGVKRAGTRAIVHRSPPIAGSGQTRLFLCLNEEVDE